MAILRVLSLVFVLVTHGYLFAWAQYPTRPINMVVPYSPGGGADLGSRVMAERMEEFLGQRMVSVYKPGGGGSLGTAFVAKAEPDGYTVLVGSITPFVVLPVVRKLDYKLEDFALVGTYGCNPLWLLVEAAAKWKTLAEFIADAKRAEGKLTVGSYGKLTLSDFVIQLFSRHAGIRVIQVPFQSSGDAIKAILGKHIDAALVSGAGGLLESGAVKILAVATRERLEGLGEIPTFSELGYPVAVRSCYSFAVPKATPKEVVNRLVQAQQKAFERYASEIKQTLRRMEIWTFPSTPQEATEDFQQLRGVIYKLAEELGVTVK